MPDIGSTVRTILVNDATVSALVSTRVYSDSLPQQVALPAITYTVVTATPNETLTAIANVSTARIQVDCFDDTRGDANTLADGVRLALEMVNHTLTGSQFVNAIHMVSGPSDSSDIPEVGSDRRRYISMMDFRVTYRTTTS